MKEGRSLVELAREIERQQSLKRDFIAPSNNMRMTSSAIEGDAVMLSIDGISNGRFGINSIAHEQIGSRLNIPKRYYDTMLSDAPDLLATNVNHWLGASRDKRMLRTLDGKARAFLSNRYRPLDNLDLMEVALPSLVEAGCFVRSAELTERRLYLKATTDRIQSEVRVGDVVEAGILITNSEVGMGSLRVEPLIFRLICVNLAVAKDMGMKKYHVGRGFGAEDEGAAEFFRDETRMADDRAFFMKVRDVVGVALSETGFEKIVSKLREATTKEITGSVEGAVEITARKFSLNETERGSVLRNLIKGGDLSMYGLSNAITAMSAEAESYDRATDLERLGGEIIELPNSAWKEIAVA